MLQRMGNKPYKDSRPCQLRKVFRGPVHRGVFVHTLQSKDKLLHLASPDTRKGAHCLWASLSSRGSYFTHGNMAITHYQETWKVVSFGLVLVQKRAQLGHVSEQTRWCLEISKKKLKKLQCGFYVKP